ncbi:MAG: hypothetical protein VKP62_13830, partial [Candidatus Sericytochromatia bacterium]|nr:hypothetical protein [Candidatus Sericytochromatia bacterium]
DTLFVPANNGKVYRYEYSGSSLTYKQTYDLASSATPLTGCTGCTEYTGLKFAAPGIAYRGRILIGDTEGYFHDYHATTGVHRKYRLSITAPIVSAPAVEIYLDGKTYTDTATGNSAAQSGAQNQLREADALHAFVSVTRDVGPVCAWVNLAERSVLFSPPLFVDDTAGGNAALWGELDSYGYTYAAGQNNVLASISLGVSANGDAVALAIEGTNIPSTSNATQVTPLGAAKSGSGSTVHSFFKFDTDQIATTGAVFDEAYVYLTTTSGSPTDSDTPAPWLYRAGGWGESGGTGDRWRGSATIWTSNSGNSLTSSNYPWVVSAETASPAMVENSATNIAVTVSSSIRWLVNSVLPAPFRVGSVGLALALQPGDNIPWNNSKAPQFQGRSDSAPPYLRVQYDVVQDRPAYAPETSPLVDATRQRVFVYNSNYLFALSYASPDSWLGNSSASLIQPTYQVAFLGRPGQTGARDSGGNYVRNRTTPVPAFDFSSIYLLSHGPNGGNFDLAMSKITPNTNSANAALGDQERAKDTQNVVASTTLSTTATGTLLVNSSPVATSTASRYMLIDPFSNLSSKGGELLFGLSGTSRVYRIGTD